MARINTYCQMAFLEAFQEKMVKINFLDSAIKGDIDSVNSLLDLYNSIYKLSDIHLDIDMNKFIEMSSYNPFLKSLIKSGTSDIIFSDENKLPEDPELIKRINKIPSFFYYEKDQTFFRNLLNIGFWGSSSELLGERLNAVNLNQTIKVDVDPAINDFNGWKNVTEKIGLPISDVIIADAYLVNENLSSVKNNVVPLIQSFIDYGSKNKQCNFSILITKTDAKEGVIRSNISFLVNEFSKVANLTFYLIKPKLLHDRHILTNYFWIHSGHSFTFYGKDFKIYKNTTLQLRSILKSHSAHYKERKVLSDIRKTCPTEYILGKKVDNNRLWVK